MEESEYKQIIDDLKEKVKSLESRIEELEEENDGYLNTISMIH